MRKFANDFPLEELPVDPDVVVALLLPPPPHPAATAAKHTMRDAAPSHFHTILRVKSYLPVLRFAVAAQRRPRRPSARCILPDARKPSELVQANVCSPRLAVCS